MKKLNVADTLIKNHKIKNHVLNGLALRYLMEEQNMVDNSAYIKRFLELSTDDKMQNEIITIQNSIQKLKVGNTLPAEKFVNDKNEAVDLSKLINKQTVIFFYNTNLQSHLTAVHKKAIALKEKHPELNFIGINIDDTFEEWHNKLSDFNHKNIVEIHAVNSEAIKEKWVVYKIHRSIILNADGTIKNAFVNLFDVNFEKDLK